MQKITIQQEDFSVETETAAMLAENPGIGGIVSFIGTVRDFSTNEDVTALELEHYPGMTERELERIVDSAKARFSVDALTIIHRVGHLKVGENIVLVIAASAHRSDAFDACRYLIDHLKVRATLWKREITGEGAKWVESCPGCEAAASQWDDLRDRHAHNHGVETEATAETHTDSHHHGHGHGHDHGHSHGHAHRDHDGVASWPGLRVAILTLSDSRDLSRDKSGDALEGQVMGYGARVASRELLPDDAVAIAKQIKRWAEGGSVDLILTTGGTGPSPRDVTPEATRQVCDRELPGFGELIRSAGLEQTRTAVFTRGVSAFCGPVLVVNLPGSTRGAVHSLEAVADLVPHALRMAVGGGH
uniref:Molybdopterin adenylyltransferase n=1 Tax=Magnetococcus massalia (strain MO-1) TaxID=451514 RepID=A0A1S7LK85_MAGMO|nr:Bifunctional molybdenum cofactor biosynthesis protein MoaE/MogA [Candidatus Magnetococcus massalia]